MSATKCNGNIFNVRVSMYSLHFPRFDFALHIVISLSKKNLSNLKLHTSR